MFRINARRAATTHCATRCAPRTLLSCRAIWQSACRCERRVLVLFRASERAKTKKRCLCVRVCDCVSRTARRRRARDVVVDCGAQHACRRRGRRKLSLVLAHGPTRRRRVALGASACVRRRVGERSASVVARTQCPVVVTVLKEEELIVRCRVRRRRTSAPARSSRRQNL